MPATKHLGAEAPLTATTWHLITGEYPPDSGGVSDYTRLVARGLVAAGDNVHVYAPPHRVRRGERCEAAPSDPGITVHRLGGRFGPRSLVALEQLLSRGPRPGRVLVQYVPHSFGFKAMNLPFAAWVAIRLRRIAPVWVMFHEVASPFRWRPPSHALLCGVTRTMARLVAGAADRVFVTIPAWGPFLKRICPRSKPAEWLPVPCTLETSADLCAVAAIREQYAPAGGFLVGHFGTFGPLIADLLDPAAVEVLRLVPGAAMLFVGRGAESFRARFVAVHPALAGRVHAAGELSAAAVAAHLRACDVLLQPYADGVSSRRTSAMAGLANGVPIVTNLGTLSETVWAGGDVAAVPTPDPVALANQAAALIVNPMTRADIGRRGQTLYRDTFALERTISRLRETG